MPANRRRVLIPRPDVVEIVTEPQPQPLPGEALVSFRVAGVCGSDTHAMHGHHPQMTLPYYPGHEVVGIVEEVGEGVDGALVGARVTPEPTLPCGACKTCRRGNENVCENLQFFGCGFREGGMADAFTVRADRLHVVPEDFTDEQAILIEPLATPVHAARIAGDLTDRAVLIQGCGTIGLLMLAAARHAGARRIVMSDVLAAKRAFAEKLGADATVDALAEDFPAAVLDALGETADVVFDCVSIPSTVAAGLAVLAKAGKLVTVGIPTRPITIPLGQVQDAQQSILGAATYVAEDYRIATDIIAAGAVDTAVMVSASYPFDQAAEAFAQAATGEQVKVVITA
jgi:2-desacetyl-2-hydroxyethyl bacteriochlorophyllide A dehydrogenase